jgi:hypothetical protein
MLYADAERLGPKQSMLTNGALLVRDVPIARTGVQHYHMSEIAGSIDDDTAIDDDGMVEVVRHPDDVFDETSVASFEGAAVVMRHPDDVVGPDNWSSVAIGHAQNVRPSGDVLIADLLIHDARGIDAIRRENWRAVSAGYDAAYHPISGGRLRQRNITANHIAILAPGELARCGPLCAVGDAAWTYGGRYMRNKDQSTGGREGGGGARADYIESKRPQNIGKSGGGDYPSGAALVMRLPGPVSAYFIAADGDGAACVYRSSDVDGALDPGRALKGDRTADAFRLAARERVEREQAAGRAMAAGIADFWATRGGGRA